MFVNNAPKKVGFRQKATDRASVKSVQYYLCMLRGKIPRGSFVRNSIRENGRILYFLSKFCMNCLNSKVGHNILYTAAPRFRRSIGSERKSCKSKTKRNMHKLVGYFQKLIIFFTSSNCNFFALKKQKGTGL